MAITIDISPGELLDRLSILEIKASRIDDGGKLRNVRHELSLTRAAREAGVPRTAEVERLYADLRAANEALWVVEDDLRDHERRGDFGARFVELARRVYVTNDRRAAVKRAINVALESAIVEEKSYAAY